MRAKVFNQVATLFGLALFGWALWVLYHELKVYHYRDIVRNLQSLPLSWLLAALGLAFLDYAVLTGYDRLAFKYLHHPLAYKKIALTSFIGYAFSHNIGLTVLTGGSVRYRFYSAWGLSAMEIAKVVLFCGLTFWLGFFLVGGFAFWLQPLVLPEKLALPFHSLRWLGWFFLVLIALYLALCFSRSPRFKRLKISKVEFSLPSPGVAAAQLAVSALDWILVASVLFVLLPRSDHLGFPTFLAIFLLAQIAGMVSQIPGGLGVFETVILLLLEAYYPASAVLGTLLAFRGIYYLLPLGGAIVLLGSHEFLTRREHIQRLVRIFGKWAPGLVPNLLALAVFGAGAILLFSGSIPPASGRLEWLHAFVPLPIIELSHFLGSMAGVGLLFLAQSLQRRLQFAYVASLCLLAAGLIFSLAKGGDFEEALAMAIVLATLIPARSHFYRLSSFLKQRLTLGWMAAIVLVLTCSVWLGLFSYKHVVYTSDLWLHFTLHNGAPRFLRALVGVFGAVLALAISRLLVSAPAPKLSPSPDDLQMLELIAAQEPRTQVQLAFLPDKSLLFADDRQAFIMYSVAENNWIAMGDPLGNPQASVELIWRFKELSEHYEGVTAFYLVGDKNLGCYSDLGLTALKIGEQARVRLESFSLSGGRHKKLRKHDQHLERAGLRFEIVPQEKIKGWLSTFSGISQAGSGSGARYFNENYLQRFPAAIIRQDQDIMAFANIWLGAGREEAAVDLVHCVPGASEDVLDLLMTGLMLWAKNAGYQWFDLGLAPLPGSRGQEAAPIWNVLSRPGGWHGGFFYGMHGLREYKEKFDPVWEPRYLAAPDGLALPKVISSIAGKILGEDKSAS